jgi:hypothetical protein
MSRVMITAKQRQVRQVGGAAVAPVLDVMGVCPPGRPIAAGERAASVAVHEGAAEWSGDQAVLSTEVEGLAGGAEHGGNDPGVTRDTAGGGRGQVGAVVEGCGADLLAQFVVVDGDDYLRSVAAVVG